MKVKFKHSLGYGMNHKYAKIVKIKLMTDAVSSVD